MSTTQFFKNVPYVKYEGPKTRNPFAFRYYNPDEIVEGKTMKEYLNFSLSWWHTLCADGTDMFGRGTMHKDFGAKDEMDLAKKKVQAGFEFMEKLSIPYFCFHDRDLAPEGKTLGESNEKLDEVVEEILKQQKKVDAKVLWGTANLFNHPRYMHGAGTSPFADVYAFAMAQVKKCIEVTIKLGGRNYLFWGGREGYETLLNTDIGFELDNMARFLTMARDYGRKLGLPGVFFIEPKPKEPTKHQYDFDTATVYGFLLKNHLEKDFRVNIEANHATLAGHTFQHELAVARANGIFGSIDANQGDLLLGWDTDQFPTNVYETTLCMCEVLKAGGFQYGGLNFDAKARRGSFTPEDIALSYIAGMDAFALGLRKAIELREDGVLDKALADRYASFQTGIGKDIVSGKATIEDLEKYALEKGEVLDSVKSGRQEYLENEMNRVLFS
ncbi:MAG: xylose isomerase [Clostridia bacterium]|nr:xylose isomerase [Clostridia bacterium]MBQ7727223.1 xylose isomerase [Clostridia bacterium]